LREHSIRVGAYQSDSTHYDDQNDCHHHGIFSNVLTIVRCEDINERLKHNHTSLGWFFEPKAKQLRGWFSGL
jgi:hypothetical protein